MYLHLVQCLEENPDFTMQLCTCPVGWLHSKWQREARWHPFLPLRMQTTRGITYSTAQIIVRGHTFELLNCALARHLITMQQAGLALHSDKNWKICLVLFTVYRLHDHFTSKSIRSSASSHVLEHISANELWFCLWSKKISHPQFIFSSPVVHRHTSANTMSLYFGSLNYPRPRHVSKKIEWEADSWFVGSLTALSADNMEVACPSSRG